MGIINRGVRDAFRNKIRTIAIVLILSLSIGLSLTMYLANQAVGRKIETVKQSIGTDITVSPAGSRGFSGGGEPLTADNVTKVGQLPHVSTVTQGLTDQLQTGSDTNLQSAIEPGSLGRRRGFRQSGGGGFGAGGGESGGQAQNGNAQATLPIFVTGASALDDLKRLGTGAVTVSSGKFDPAGSGNTAIVGKDLATKNNLAVGSTFQAYGTTLTVDGIYDSSGNRFGNSGIVMPLETLRRLANEPGQSTTLVVQADSIANADQVAANAKQVLGDAADVTSPTDSSSQVLAPLTSIQRVTTASLSGAVAAGAVIIFLTMLMIVRERRREIGVLKAIGASNVSIVAQFAVEALTFTLLAAIVGTILGILFSGAVTDVLVSSNTGAPGMGRGGFAALRNVNINPRSLRDIHAAIGTDVALYGLGVAVLIALVGSAIPAWLIAKVRPAEAMRGE